MFLIHANKDWSASLEFARIIYRCMHWLNDVLKMPATYRDILFQIPWGRAGKFHQPPSHVNKILVNYLMRARMILHGWGEFVTIPPPQDLKWNSPNAFTQQIHVQCHIVMHSLAAESEPERNMDTTSLHCQVQSGLHSIVQCL